jgi:hypothetical protein
MLRTAFAAPLRAFGRTVSTAASTVAAPVTAAETHLVARCMVGNFVYNDVPGSNATVGATNLTAVEWNERVKAGPKQWLDSIGFDAGKVGHPQLLSEIEELERDNYQQQQKIEDLKENIEQQRSEIADRAEAMKEYEEHEEDEYSIEELEQEIQELEDENEQQECKLGDLEMENCNQRSEIQGLTVSPSCFEEENQEHQCTIDELQENYYVQQSEIEELEDESREQEQKLEELSQEHGLTGSLADCADWKIWKVVVGVIDLNKKNEPILSKATHHYELSSGSPIEVIEYIQSHPQSIYRGKHPESWGLLSMNLTPPQHPLTVVP